MDGPCPIGPEVDSGPAKRPERITIEGAWVRLEPLDAARHSDALWSGTGGAANESLWRYMADGPFPDRRLLDGSLTNKAASDDPLFSAIVDRDSDQALGYAALMRIEPKH